MKYEYSSANVLALYDEITGTKPTRLDETIVQILERVKTVERISRVVPEIQQFFGGKQDDSK